ncbi:MAG: hypothetical protein M1831_002980 [Alyxoria varia]|nr:MAG: hypothetical protein M1831_002980 [Alyxoria varia]
MNDAALGAYALRAVQVEALVVMRLIKHATQTFPTPAAGSIVGMDVNGVLEITNSFPLPSPDASAADAHQDSVQNLAAAAPRSKANGAYQNEMIRLFKEVNVDANNVGWYMSTNMGNFVNLNMIENQFHYQKEMNERTVALVYDTSRSIQGSLNLRAFRLAPNFMTAFKEGKFTTESIQKSGLRYQDILIELPLSIHNSHLLNSLLHQLPAPPPKDALPMPPALSSLQDRSSMPPYPLNPNLDTFDLSIDPFLEKTCDQLLDTIENHHSELNNHQYYQRSLAREQAKIQTWQQKRKTENAGRQASKQPLLPEDEWQRLFKLPQEPSRLEILLNSRQIEQYARQVDQFTANVTGKMFAVKSPESPHGTRSYPCTATTKNKGATIHNPGAQKQRTTHSDPHNQKPPTPTSRSSSSSFSSSSFSGDESPHGTRSYSFTAKLPKKGDVNYTHDLQKQELTHSDHHDQPPARTLDSPSSSTSSSFSGPESPHGTRSYSFTTTAHNKLGTSHVPDLQNQSPTQPDRHQQQPTLPAPPILRSPTTRSIPHPPHTPNRAPSTPRPALHIQTSPRTCYRYSPSKTGIKTPHSHFKHNDHGPKTPEPCIVEIDTSTSGSRSSSSQLGSAGLRLWTSTDGETPASGRGDVNRNRHFDGGRGRDGGGGSDSGSGQSDDSAYSRNAKRTHRLSRAKRIDLTNPGDSRKNFISRVQFDPPSPASAPGPRRPPGAKIRNRTFIRRDRRKVQIQTPRSSSYEADNSASENEHEHEGAKPSNDNRRRNEEEPDLCPTCHQKRNNTKQKTRPLLSRLPALTIPRPFHRPSAFTLPRRLSRFPSFFTRETSLLPLTLRRPLDLTLLTLLLLHISLFTSIAILCAARRDVVCANAWLVASLNGYAVPAVVGGVYTGCAVGFAVSGMGRRVLGRGRWSGVLFTGVVACGKVVVVVGVGDWGVSVVGC